MSQGSQVVTRNRPPKCAMGTGGWCSYGASDEHQQAQGLLELARRQLLQVGGFAGSRRGCVRVGVMAAAWLPGHDDGERLAQSMPASGWCLCHPKGSRTKRGGGS